MIAPTPTPTPIQRVRGCNNVTPNVTIPSIYRGSTIVRDAKASSRQTLSVSTEAGQYIVIYQTGAYKKNGAWLGASSDIAVEYYNSNILFTKTNFVDTLTGMPTQRDAEAASCGAATQVFYHGGGKIVLNFTGNSNNFNGNVYSAETNGSGSNPTFRLFKLNPPPTPTPTPVQRIRGCDNDFPINVTEHVTYQGGTKVRDARYAGSQQLGIVPAGEYVIVYKTGAYKKDGAWYGVSDVVFNYSNFITGAKNVINVPALSGSTTQREAEQLSCGYTTPVFNHRGGPITFSFTGKSTNINGNTYTTETNGSGLNPWFKLYKVHKTAPTPTPTKTPVTPTPTRTPTKSVTPTRTPAVTRTPTPTLDSDIPWYPTQQGFIDVGTPKVSKIEYEYDEDTFWTYVQPGNVYAVTVSSDNIPLGNSVRTYESGYFLVPFTHNPYISFVAMSTAVAFTVRMMSPYYAPSAKYSILVTALTGGLPTPTPTPTKTKTPTPTPTPTKTPTIIWDTDAVNYIQAVEAADGQSLEPEIKIAINDFVRDLKADNNWNNISAACILAGARTLSGALVPLRGPAPINYNFTEADYHRSSGLQGNGDDKLLDSNFSVSALPYSNRHASFYVSSLAQNKPETSWNPELHFLIYSSENHPNGNTPDSCTILATHTTLDGMYYNLNTTSSGYRAFVYSGITPQLGLYGATTDRLDSNYWNMKLGTYYEESEAHGLTYRQNPANVPTYIFGTSDTYYGLNALLRGSWYSLGTNITFSTLSRRLEVLLQSIARVIPKIPTPTPTPSQTPPPGWNGRALYSANSIPVTVTASISGDYIFSGIETSGTLNPALTCYRGANYNFNLNVSPFAFALRNYLDDPTPVVGTYNNKPDTGSLTGTVMFTPASGTPSNIVYQSTIMPWITGSIQIKD